MAGRIKLSDTYEELTAAGYTSWQLWYDMTRFPEKVAELSREVGKSIEDFAIVPLIESDGDPTLKRGQYKIFTKPIKR